VDIEDEASEIGVLVRQGLVVKVTVPSGAVPGVPASDEPYGKILNSYVAFAFSKMAGSSVLTVGADSDAKDWPVIDDPLTRSAPRYNCASNEKLASVPPGVIDSPVSTCLLLAAVVNLRPKYLVASTEEGTLETVVGSDPVPNVRVSPTTLKS
jgi:hypothetical protein